MNWNGQQFVPTDFYPYNREPSQVAISVIMPVCNAQQTIVLALDSLAAQDFSDFEIIVVDDASTDATFECICNFKESNKRFNDERMKVVRQPHAGAASARNKGMRMARGEYYLFLDADDVFEPTMLSMLYRAATVSRAPITICNADCFTTNPAVPVRTWGAGQQELTEGVYTADQLAQKLYQCTTMVLWNKLFSAAFIHEHEILFQQIPRFNDNYFTILALACAPRICKVSDVLVHYRVAAGTSLVDQETVEPYCDLWALDAARTTLREKGLLHGALQRSFDTFCISTVVWRLAHFARKDAQATRALYEAYFGHYEAAWGLATATWPYIRSDRYALEYALIKRAGVEGLLHAAAPDTRDRRSGRNVAAELAFAARLAKSCVRPAKEERGK